MAYRTNSANGAVREYFQNHPNTEVWLPELRQALHDRGFYRDDDHLKGVINNVRGTTFGNHITTVTPAQCWLYNAPPSGSVALINAVAKVAKDTLDQVVKQRVFYEVMERKSYLLIEDEDGVLYIAKEIG